MTSERRIWAAALLLVRRYDDDAVYQAGERSLQLFSEGDYEGAIPGVAS